jgi:hypothetical protein
VCPRPENPVTLGLMRRVAIIASAGGNWIADV